MNKNTSNVVKCDDTDGDYVKCVQIEHLQNLQGGHKEKDQDYSDTRMYGEAVQIFEFFLLLQEICIK